RGNRYLRMLFVQAARAVLLRPQSWEKHGLKSWIEAAARRLNRFKLAIALANKIARIVWGVLHGGRNFEIKPMKPASQAASIRTKCSQSGDTRCKRHDLFPTEVCERNRRDGEMVFPAHPRTDDPNSPPRHGR